MEKELRYITSRFPIRKNGSAFNSGSGIVRRRH